MLRVGTVDKATMGQFDESCLTAPPPFEPAQIKRLREANNVSQPVFARYLNTSLLGYPRLASCANPRSTCRMGERSVTHHLFCRIQDRLFVCAYTMRGEVFLPPSFSPIKCR